MLLKKVLSGKERITLQCDIKIISVTEVPSSKTNNNCGGNIFIEWKKGRGSKDHGETRHCLCKARDIEFNETIAFNTHVARDPKTGICDPKPLVFSLKYTPTEDQKPKSLGEVTVDLGDFAKTHSLDERRSVTFLKKKKETRAALHMNIQAKWLKVDKKPYDASASGGENEIVTAQQDDGNETSESEITHMSDSDIVTSEMEDEDPDELAHHEASTEQKPTARRKSSKRLSGEIPTIMEDQSSPRKRGSDSEKDSDSSGKEKGSSLSRRSSTKEPKSKTASSRELKSTDKEKKKKAPKVRPFSADLSGLNLATPDALESPNRKNRPLGAYSSMGALSLSPGGAARTAHETGLQPALVKKQRRRSLEPNSPAANAILATVASVASSSDAAPLAQTIPQPAHVPAPDPNLHTELKIQQEVEMAHEEVRSLRRELMSAQQKIRLLEQERQRLIQTASALQQAQSAPNVEYIALQEIKKKHQAVIEEQEATIQTLRSELARAKAVSSNQFDRSRPPAVLKPLLPQKEERGLLIVILIIFLLLGIVSSFTSGSSSATETLPIEL